MYLKTNLMITNGASRMQVEGNTGSEETTAGAHSVGHRQHSAGRGGRLRAGSRARVREQSRQAPCNAALYRQEACTTSSLFLKVNTGSVVSQD